MFYLLRLARWVRFRRKPVSKKVWREVLQSTGCVVSLGVMLGYTRFRRLGDIDRFLASIVRSVHPSIKELVPVDFFLLCAGPRRGVSAHIFRSTTKEWNPLPDVPEGMRECGVAALLSCVFVAGGYCGERDIVQTINNFFQLDLTTGIWIALPNMPTARAGCAAVACHGKIYVIGGLDHMERTRGALEAYDPKQQMWCKLQGMTTARYSCAAAAIGATLYVAGGRSRDRNRGAMESYSVSAQVWTTQPPMHFARAGCSAVACQRKVYVAGGYFPSDPYQPPDDDNATVEDEGPPPAPIVPLEVFDPQTCLWTTLGSMPTPRGGCALVTASGRIYVIGGSQERRTDTGASDAVECFEVESGEWTRLAKVPSSFGFTVGVALRL